MFKQVFKIPMTYRLKYEYRDTKNGYEIFYMCKDGLWHKDQDVNTGEYLKYDSKMIAEDYVEMMNEALWANLEFESKEKKCR